MLKINSTHIRFQLVIPTHKRTDHLALLLDSVVALAQPELLDAVWVVENGSAVARALTESYADRLPIRYHHFSEGNKSKALNEVLPKLDPACPTVNLDDDVLLPPNLLRGYAEAIRQFGPGHYYGGPTTVRYEVDPDPQLVPWMPVSNRGFRLPHDRPTAVGRKTFLGCNWVSFPADVRAVGGYSTAYGPGAKSGARGQETDMQYRLAEAGVTAVYVPGEPVSHWVPAKCVTEKWVLDRVEKTAMQRGKREGTLSKRVYWTVMMYYYRYKGAEGKYLESTYLGLVRGSKERTAKANKS